MTDSTETAVNVVDTFLLATTVNDNTGGLEVGAGERSGMIGVSMDEGQIQLKGGPRGIEAGGLLDPDLLLRQ